MLLVCDSPYTSQSADTALQFSQALINQGHTLLQVFFYYDGVYVSSSLANPERPERAVTQNWAQFAKEHAIDLVVCSNSAMKRGILDQQLAQQFEKASFNLHSQFKMAGLGQFVDAVSLADRVITFKR